MVLARTVNGKGTAELFITASGDLGYRYETPNTTVGKDLAENIRLGNVTQSSFAFTIAEEEWVMGRDNEPDVRVIKKVERLYDVSPVTYPAYQDTSVGERSLNSAKEELSNTKEKELERQREAEELDKELIKYKRELQKLKR